jgi:hypothetical protein
MGPCWYYGPVWLIERRDGEHGGSLTNSMQINHLHNNHAFQADADSMFSGKATLAEGHAQAITTQRGLPHTPPSSCL